MWIEWAADDAEHISTRSRRYPGAIDLSAEWAHEAVNDRSVVVVDPYPGSRIRATAFVGFSPGAGRVLVVLAYLKDDGRWHGRTAWPATGHDLVRYEERLVDDR